MCACVVFVTLKVSTPIRNANSCMIVRMPINGYAYVTLPRLLKTYIICFTEASVNVAAFRLVKQAELEMAMDKE